MKKWQNEKWTTSDGKPSYRKDSKSKTVAKRYRPERVWKKLSSGEKSALNASKNRGFQKGRRIVSLPRSLRRKAKV